MKYLEIKKVLCLIVALTTFCCMLAGCRTEVTSLSPEMDLQIRDDFKNVYYKDDESISAEELKVDFVAEYHGVYVIYMGGPFLSLDAATGNRIEDLEFLYSKYPKMVAYQDGRFFQLEEAYENKIMSYADFQKLYELHIKNNPNQS